MTRRAIFAVLVTLVATPALAAEIPPRKAGLWEVQTPGSSGTFRKCIDAATDQMLQARSGAAIGPAGPSPQCAKRDVQKSGDTIMIDAACTTAGKTVTSHAVVTASFDSAYTMTVTTQGDGIPGSSRTVTVTAKWLSPCAADQKPGDMIMPNGIRVNILACRSAASRRPAAAIALAPPRYGVGRSARHPRCRPRALSLCSRRLSIGNVRGIAMADESQLKPREVKIKVHDGVEIAVALYIPPGEGKFPTVLAPSPYRYDNNTLPATPQFLWRETGPIELYVARGYVYAHMDIRGCGKSDGEFRLLDRNEQKDLYDVIEWLGHQAWSNGKVGGIGQSYFCMSQWWMAIQKPPSLACIAAFDGLNDPYRASVYQGGILGDFFGSYWWNQNRIINRNPANGEHPREQTCDLNLLIQQHPTYDEFWRERCAAERLEEIEVPLYSVGVWGKVDLHTRGNINGFRRAKGPKKLKMIGPINAFVANKEFNSAELHEKMLLPFYDHYLKGLDTDYAKRPTVEYFVRGADAVRTAESWPPPSVRYVTWHLSAEKSGSVTSLNDGTLSRAAASGEAATPYTYPNLGWMLGVVGFGPNNQPDPARRVLTFTTAPLEQDLEIAGPIKLVLHAASSRTDMDFFVKLSEQMPQSPDDRAKGLNPASYWITKGWLRASHRALDPAKSTEMEPYHGHTKPTPIEPGKIYRFDISVEPMAHRFKKGNRLRLEIVNGDSAVTDILWTHYYAPNKIGTDTIYHSAQCPSALTLPVTEGA